MEQKANPWDGWTKEARRNLVNNHFLNNIKLRIKLPGQIY
jgi:hypothetical protein